jgi:hypothetical protein
MKKTIMENVLLKNEYDLFISELEKGEASKLVGKIFPIHFDQIDRILIDTMMYDDDEKLARSLRLACMYQGIPYRPCFLDILSPHLVTFRALLVLL